MSLKPVNVPRALQTLRQENPSAEATEALLQSLHRPVRRRNVARPLAFAMTATALVLALLLPPRTNAGAAWAQAVGSTLDAPTRHRVDYRPDGSIELEEWCSGAKRTTLTYRDSGILDYESRRDGRRRFEYIGRSQPGVFSKASVNARRFATVSNEESIRVQDDPTTVEEILRNPLMEIVGHDEADGARGIPERYRLRVIPEPKRELLVTVAAGSRRVLAVQNLQDGRRTVIDYPAGIPDVRFEPRAQSVKGVETYDGETVGEAARSAIDKRLAKQGPITLRLAVLDAYGALWVYWTGSMPDARLSRPFHIVGVRTSPPFGTKAYMTEWRKEARSRFQARLLKGERVGGMGVTPKIRLGKTIDLDIPSGKGYVRFRNVPVLRVGTLSQVEQALLEGK